MNRFMNVRPRLLLVYSDSFHASQCGRFFRRLGWEVRMVASGCEARRQVGEFRPSHVVVDVDLPDETGWLTCAKIMLERAAARVFIQVPERDEEAVRRMHFVNLDGLLTRDETMDGLADLVLGQALTETAP